jgi:predicted enzyme related to lactoylglutathione lyase
MTELLVNIDVPDIEAGTAFYTEGLGFSLVRILGGRVAEMRLADCRMYLLAKDAGSNAVRGTALSRNYSRHWTPVHLDLAVDDIALATVRACESGATLESGPTSHAWGTISELSDPFGNGFCLIQFTREGYDAIES